MTREDFIFTIGFDGDGPVVDKLNAKKFGKLGTGDRGFIQGRFLQVGSMLCGLFRQ